MSMPSTPVSTPAVKAAVKDFSFSYGDVQVLKHLHMTFADKQVTALIGPSGCGKTTLLRCFNRMHDLYPGIRYTGEILLYPDGMSDYTGLLYLGELVEIDRTEQIFQSPSQKLTGDYLTGRFG